MTAQLNGHQFLAMLRCLPTEDLDMPADTLLDLYDGPACDDCGRRHLTPWAAIACDERIDARARKIARRTARKIGARAANSGTKDLELIEATS